MTRDRRLDESHLTGESEDVLKDWEAAPTVASGSRVLEGLGRCIVLAVGENSQQGIIAAMVAGVEDGEDDLRRGHAPLPTTVQPVMVAASPHVQNILSAVPDALLPASAPCYAQSSAGRSYSHSVSWPSHCPVGVFIRTSIRLYDALSGGIRNFFYKELPYTPCYHCCSQSRHLSF